MKASIIIPTYNKAPYLNLTLASFVNQRYPAYEVIVINDGSVDDTEAVVRQYADRMDLHYISQSNQGRAAARNAGIHQATGDFILFNDDDRIAHPSLLRQHAQSLSAAALNHVVVGWKYRILSIWNPAPLVIGIQDVLAIVEKNPDLISVLRREQQQPLITPQDIAVDFDGAIERILIGEEQDNNADIIATFGEHLAGFLFAWVLGTTANMAVPTACVREIGMFDTQYQGWGGEDTDLAYRLFLSGAKFMVNKSAANFHQVHPLFEVGGIAQTPEHRFQQGLENVRYFCDKFKTLETYLYRRWLLYDLDIGSANDILKDHLSGVAPALSKELIRLYSGHTPLA